MQLRLSFGPDTSPEAHAPSPHLHVRPRLAAMSVAAAGQDDVYESLEQYAWDDDAEFQSGLSAILGSNASPEQASELALRARCFYFARHVSTLQRARPHADCLGNSTRTSTLTRTKPTAVRAAAPRPTA